MGSSKIKPEDCGFISRQAYYLPGILKDTVENDLSDERCCLRIILWELMGFLYLRRVDSNKDPSEINTTLDGGNYPK